MEPEKIDASPFWANFEAVVSCWEDLDETIDGIYREWLEDGERRFAWRGVSDATYGLHSSLFRHLQKRNGNAPPSEAEMFAREEVLLSELRRWGLHHGPRGRISALEQLAWMQHQGAPTRLIDITFNAHVGAWFAASAGPERDGRLFAIDVTGRVVNDLLGGMPFADTTAVPWNADGLRGPLGDAKPREWFTHTWAWRPPPVDPRMAAQYGGFLLGGIPNDVDENRKRYWPKTTAGNDNWDLADVRRFTSVAVRPHKLNPEAGRPPERPFYTIRIEATAKREILRRLESLYGLHQSVLFPDINGFVANSG